jgi:hypothetical protein
MPLRKMLVLLLGALVASALISCATTDEETKPNRVPQTRKARVTSARHAGVREGHPAVEISGSLPGPGWVAELGSARAGGQVEVWVLAVPGPHARRGDRVTFSQTFVVRDASPGTTVRVLDHRGVEIRRFR